MGKKSTSMPTTDCKVTLQGTKTTMENIYKLSVPLKVSTDSGKNWYDAK